MFSTTSLVTVSTAQTPPYHCTSLQHLQSGHSCVVQWDWCYTQAEMTQFHCKLSCQTKWGQIPYQKIQIHFWVPHDLKKRYKVDIFYEKWVLQSILKCTTHHFHWIPAVYRPLQHQVHPRNRHTQCHMYCYSRFPLFPLFGYCLVVCRSSVEPGHQYNLGKRRNLVCITHDKSRWK